MARRLDSRWALAAAVLVGTLLRLVWSADMEYKADEARLWALAFHGAWPWVGDASGVGVPNPGMGIWVFSGLKAVLPVDSPLGLGRAVMALNVLALAGLAVFAMRAIAPERREPWLWATALVALSPPAVLFSRKIWIQSVLPPFVLAALAGWWFRARAAGAFTWGLAGAWLGQIHMSGFFFAAGLAGWTALFARRSARWRWWLAGSVVGALTLLPWLHHVLTHPGGGARSLRHLVDGR